MSSAAVASMPNMNLLEEGKVLPQGDALSSSRCSSHKSLAIGIPARPSKRIAPAALNRHRSSDGYMSSFLAPSNAVATKQLLPQQQERQQQHYQREKEAGDVRHTVAPSNIKSTLAASPPNPARKTGNRRHALSLTSPPKPVKKKLPHRSISMSDARLGGSNTVATKPRLHRNSSSSSSSALSQIYDETDDAVLEDLVEMLRRHRQMLGDNHVKVGQSYNRLGNCHYRRGEFDDAASSYMFAMDCFRKGIESELGSFASSLVLSTFSSSSSSWCTNEHLDTTTRTSLAYAFSAKNEQQKRENCRKRLMGVAVTLSNLGALCWRTGRVEDAICSLEESLEIHMRTTRPSDNVTSSKSSMEESQSMTLDYFYHGGRRNVEWSESSSPSNSSLSSTSTCSSLSSGTNSSNNRILTNADNKLDVACTLYNLGIARCLRGDHDEALEAFAQCRSVQIDTFGTWTHVEVARAVDAMGRVYLQMDRVDEAMECHQEALRVKRLLMGPRHPSVVCAMLNMAAVHRRLGDTGEAIVVMEEVLKAQKSLLRILRLEAGNNGSGASSKNPYRTAALDYASSLHLMGDLHGENGDAKAARKFLAEAMKVYVKDGRLVAGLGIHKRNGQDEGEQYFISDEQECDPRILGVKRSQEVLVEADE